MRLSQLWFELIFFTEVCMVLCFGLEMKITLITHWYFSCCRALLNRAVAISASQDDLTVRSWGAQDADQGHSQDSWHRLTKEIFHTMWCYAIKDGVAGRVAIGVTVVAFPSTHYIWGSPHFALLASTAFAAAVFISSHEFSHFHLSNSLCHHTVRGTEQVAVWCWPAAGIKP